MSDFLNSILTNNLFHGFLISLFFVWLGYVAHSRPKPNKIEILESYIDDSTIRKVEMFECSFDWGTRLWFYRTLKIKDIPLQSIALLRYTPLAGVEIDLPEENYETNPLTKKNFKPLKLKNKHFFKTNSINKVKIFLQTPFEREKYEINIKRIFEGNKLTILNENSEEIRNFRVLINKPVKLNQLKVLEGRVDSVELEIALAAINNVISKKIGTVTNDVSISLIVDLVPKRMDNDEKIVILLGN